MPRLNDISKVNTGDWWMDSKYVVAENHPIDLCCDCWESYGLDAGDETDHPDYNDRVYRCVSCGAMLYEDVDGGAYLH